MPIKSKKVETLFENDRYLVEMVTVELEPVMLHWSEPALSEEWPLPLPTITIEEFERIKADAK